MVRHDFRQEAEHAKSLRDLKLRAVNFAVDRILGQVLAYQASFDLRAPSTPLGVLNRIVPSRARPRLARYLRPISRLCLDIADKSNAL